RAMCVVQALQFIELRPRMTVEQYGERVARLDTLLNELALRGTLTLHVLLRFAHFQTRDGAGGKLTLHERQRALQTIEALLSGGNALIEERERPIKIACVADEQERG